MTVPRYQQTADPSVWRRLADGAFISHDVQNGDYRAALADVTADPSLLATADPPPLTYAGSLPVESRIRTTDATVTEVYRRTLAPLTGYAAILNLLGVDAGNGAVRMIRASIVAKRLGGSALLVGAPVVLANHADVAASTWAITAAVGGNDVVISVTGAAGRTIDWLLSGDVHSFTPAGA